MEFEKDVTIVELFNYLWNECYNLNDIESWFDNEGFIMRPVYSKLDQNTVIIFYKNYIQKWNLLWHRQARGVVLNFNEKIGLWRPIKYMFPRGVEVLTSSHIESGITNTENIAKNDLISLNLSGFDESQKKVITKLMSEGELDNHIKGVLSMKVDGMLTVITLYTGKLRKSILKNINGQTDSLLKTLHKLAKRNKCKFLPIISTQKTFNVTDKSCIDYIVTSLLLSTLDFDTIDTIVNDINNKNDLSSCEVLKKYGDNLMKSLNIFYNNYSDYCGDHSDSSSEWVSLCLEAVCPQRRCFWNTTHTELAVSYPNGFCKILSFSNSLHTIPHFIFSDMINKMGFEEPYWWKLENGLKIDSVLKKLSEYISNNSVDFLQFYPPSNSYKINNNYIDPEGFILWSLINDNNNNNDNIDKNNKYDYHKIKTVEYYEAHSSSTKPSRFLKLAEATTIFPIANKVKEFFSTLAEKLSGVSKCFLDIMNSEISKENKTIILKNLTVANNNLLNYILDGMSLKAVNSFKSYKYNLPIQCRMILNSGFRATQVINAIFMEYFPELGESVIADPKILRHLIMTIAPWRNNTEQINIMVSEIDESVEKFYKMVFDKIVG